MPLLHSANKGTKLLNFQPDISLENGLTEPTEWLKPTTEAMGLFEKALKELEKKASHNLVVL